VFQLFPDSPLVPSLPPPYPSPPQYFDDQSLYGEAGPPVYIVLQNVNYTHPDTPGAVSTMVNAITGVSRWIDPPVANWVGQFAYWDGPVSRAAVAKNPSDCPMPLGESEAGDDACKAI